MAVAQGTATNFLEFYEALRDFLKTDPNLVADGQEWAQIYGPTGSLSFSDEIVLQGPGLAGSDEVRIGLVPDVDAVSGRYNLTLRAYPIWNPVGVPSSQFNRSEVVSIQLWNSAIPYTFVASGRRFVAVAQVTSVVQACYGGLFLPYALPSEYPLPLAVGGSASVTNWLYSEVNVRHSHFVNPSGALKVYGPHNAWLDFSNFTLSGGTYSWLSLASTPGNLVAPYNATSSALFRTVLNNLRECFGGGYPLHPLILLSGSTPGGARLGVLDGCYHVPGIGTSHGSLLDVNAPGDHMVVQNVARTDNMLGYWALKLE